MMSDNRFGMFIHWGLYAMSGLHEQAFARYDLPREEYENQMHEFRPIGYDPEEWVLAAKKAGMEYICFTAKHHDGFCMWDTRYTDFSIMNTPYGKDVLGMLALACWRHGMKLSIYYSIPDWHHPHAYNPKSSHQWKAIRQENADFSLYVQYIKNQITELLTHYGPIYTLFWDIPPCIEDPSLNELVRRLQPNILINDRGFDGGDFSTPEREYVSTPNCQRFPHRTEACNSLGAESWGYRKNEDFYSFRHLASAIDRIMAMGGSYLLNIGPDELGRLPEEALKRLDRIGNWYSRMKGCLTGHDAQDFDYQIPRDPCIINQKEGKTYFHFYQGLTTNAVVLKKVPSIPQSVTLLNTDEPMDFSMELLPECFDPSLCRIPEPALRIRNIPVDDLSAEPIVLAIEWQ